MRGQALQDVQAWAVGYCAQMHRIEDQWHQLIAHQIAGQMFEDEDDLALAVLKGIEPRSESGGYSLERFKFKST